MPSVADEQTDWKAIAKTLSESYSAILQHSTFGIDNIKVHLSRLANYSNHLPLPWFTTQFLRILIALERQFNSHDDILGSIFALFSSWIRRLVGEGPAATESEPLLPQVVELMTRALADLPDRESTTNIRKDAFIGLVALVGHATPDIDDALLVNAVTEAVKQYSTKNTNTSLTEVLDAGVAHCLGATSTLNVFEMENCQALLNAFVQSAAARHLIGVRSAVSVIEHAVDVRLQQKPHTRAEADLDSLFTIISKASTTSSSETFSVQFTRLALLTGFVRLLQFTRVHTTKKIRELRQQAETLFIQGMNTAVRNVNSPSHAHSFSTNQDSITFLAGQCLPNATTQSMIQLNNKGIVQLLVSCLLTSERVWKCSSVLRELRLTQHNTEALKALTSDPFFYDVGRISRATSRVIQTLLQSEQKIDTVAVQNVLNRLVGCSYNVLDDWDRYLRKTPSSIKGGSDMLTEFDKAVWAIFKSMLFSFTAILKAVAVDVPNGAGLVKVPGAARDIVYIYANLHFVSIKLGSASSFQAYQDTLMNATAYLRHEGNTEQLNELLSLSYQQYAPSRFITDNTPPTTTLSPVHQARLTFLTNLIEQVMGDITDNVLENDILPVIYPVLGWQTILDRELYESAHSAILSVFDMKKSVASQVAGVYAQILVKGYPDPMSQDQLRYAYCTMVHSLCEIDDALAWLTVSHLLDKIHSLKDEKDAPLRLQYISVLIDLSKPMSLGPFFGQILNEIKQLMLDLPTHMMQQSAMKTLFETVSGPGISDMRRVEAVGWFLDLRQHILHKADLKK